MFSQWFLSGYKMTPIHVTTVLFSLFLMPALSEGQLGGMPVVMYPNEYDQVIEVGTTLNLTCVIPPTFQHDTFYIDTFNISWTVPKHLIKNDLVRNIF